MNPIIETTMNRQGAKVSSGAGLNHWFNWKLLRFPLHPGASWTYAKNILKLESGREGNCSDVRHMASLQSMLSGPKELKGELNVQYGGSNIINISQGSLNIRTHESHQGDLFYLFNYS